ncbi:redoxin domain-containing protein [Limnoglobus roseus]|uniref:Peroxiredoxin n=1 Tax=Limnoglobus roseus TaxID=2598579 RepID=A0A5C1AA52_9BACT|nr:redoxin domain-containing protein [Limnoglobus roseus]QEL15087.1 peroxiredoxin [Limnoglobus roseus]
MRRGIVTGLLLAAAAAALVAAYLRPPRLGHPVTPFMRSDAESEKGKLVARLLLPLDHPAVVVFILPGCPCSEAFEPFVGRLHEAHADRVAVVGVVAGDASAADQWANKFRSPYRMVPDVDRAIAREFGAKRSAYTALVVGGKIVRLWPGYSAGMLRELDGMLTDATKAAERPIAVDGAPEPLTSGCLLDE